MQIDTSSIMNFKIEEKERAHGFLDGLKKIFSNISKLILIIFLLPVIMITWFTNKFKKQNKPTPSQKWEVFIETNIIKLSRHFINENDCPEDLDYPEISNDIYLFKIKSESVSENLEDKYFYHNYTETENGIYLISFNHTGHGMTLWFISKKTAEVEAVKELLPNWWDLSIKGKNVILKATGRNRDYHIEVKEQAVIC